MNAQKYKLTSAAIIMLLISSIAVSQTASKAKSLGVFELVEYERKETFAGKLGNRVREKLTLKQGGKAYTLSFGAYHTRIAGQTVKPFCPGCPVEVKKGKFAKNTIVAERRDVVQLHEKESPGHKPGSK
ncbi:MAG TPA: hypothetical protein PKY51_10040 [Fimbriimonadaceae bacterium]|jgi:hypothetical protein|nr:hypothetical protein [Fimbriimonadaceae bacterium]